MRLSVIIVSYNVKYYLAQCLYSLSKALRGIESEVIVFDNHSHDGSVEHLSTLFPKVNFISSNHNLGFARANNQAIKQSKGDYILLLNPDTIVGEGTLRKALAFMDNHPKAGAAGTRMMRTDGSDAMESRRGIPTPLTAFFKMSGLCRRYPKHKHFGKYYMGWLPWDTPQEIEIISGAFFLSRREVLLGKVGMLDEDFFMYGEDIDLSYRVLKNGWENWYLPYRILHYKGESTQKSSFRYVHVFYEAMLIFFRKHYNHLSIIFSLPVKIAIYSKATMSLLSAMMGRLRKSLGFTTSSSNIEPLYAFYVRPENMERCQTLARHKGLWSEFHDANPMENGISHYSQTGKKAYIVYDVSAYSFDDMFKRMAENKNESTLIATYYPTKNMIITEEEVIYE